MWDRLLHQWLRAPYLLHLKTIHRAKHPVLTVVFIHGIGRSSLAWQAVIDKLPDNIEILSIDLLGFGKSPKPFWPEYNAKIQARSVITTLLRANRLSNLTVVGHSLGALVAIEIAKTHPGMINDLILCSPPLYRSDKKNGRDRRLKDIYKMAKEHPDEIVKMSELATRYGLADKTLDISSRNIHAYMSALEASIINQTSLKDALKIKVPSTIIHGVLDPIVINKNLRYLTSNNKKVKLTTVVAGHEVSGRYVKKVIELLNDSAERSAQAVKQMKNRV